MLNKTRPVYLVIIFLIINFGALYIGGNLMGEGPTGNWYQNLNIAPWTPPGFVFGLAWTLIMITFSIFMKNMILDKAINQKTVIALFLIQLVLNVSWNFTFFYSHLVLISLVVISSLWLVILAFIIKYSKPISLNFWLIFPYGLWLTIATTLNLYILLNN